MTDVSVRVRVCPPPSHMGTRAGASAMALPIGKLRQEPNPHQAGLPNQGYEKGGSSMCTWTDTHGSALLLQTPDSMPPAPLHGPPTHWGCGCPPWWPHDDSTPQLPAGTREGGPPCGSGGQVGQKMSLRGTRTHRLVPSVPELLVTPCLGGKRDQDPLSVPKELSERSG